MILLTLLLQLTLAPGPLDPAGSGAADGIGGDPGRGSDPAGVEGEALHPQKLAGIEAVVIAIQGEFELHRSGEAPARLRIGELLEEGDELRPTGEGRALLLLRAGRVLELRRLTEIEGTEGERTPFFGLVAGLIERFSERPPAASGAADGPAPSTILRPIQPANGIPIRVLNPALVWSGGEPGRPVRITLRPERGERMAFEPPPSGVAVLPAELALSPGMAYDWWIEPIGGEPSLAVRFQVLPREAMDRIAVSLSALREAGLDPEGDGALIALALFHQENLLYDALALLAPLTADAELPLHPALPTLHSYLIQAARPGYLAPPPSGGR